MAINVNVGANTDPLTRDVHAAVDRINKSGRLKIRLDEKGVTQPLGRMTRSADEFTKSLEASNARVLAFGASVGIINAVTNAFKGLVTTTMQVEKNLADINVVMGLSNKQLDKFGSGLFKVAKETGAGFSAASDAATEFARQGLTVVETLKRTKDALILTRLTGMDAAESVKSLTAAMNTFGSQVKDSTELVSKFAAVDVKFAVSAGDFAQAISRAGQSAKEAGVDINEFIGMVTAAQERTARGGAVIGNALKTIFTRTQKPQTLRQLQSIGVATSDLNGRTLEADVILGNLAKKWGQLTDAQRANTGQTVAGMFQINILKAVLNDAAKANSVYARSSQIAANATDESSKKNEMLRQTMSALAGETGVAVQEMAKKIGDIALAPGISKVLDNIKGAAEWFTGVLGDGEGEGNDFAKGLLKGVGNVLTGPGMVMIAAIMGKLFINAAKYASSSMGSLLNLNKAAATRKATEQALMQVLVQEDAIQKEMLRTDISRLEKEKYILEIIRKQTSEASRLSAITKSMAPSLMRQGVGPNLSMRSGRAGGIIPNYADPATQERREALKGGYVAGPIKQGPGFVYNGREQFKNFPGIGTGLMPPSPSKAADAYANDFYNAHGFNPYAASGVVPNFAKSLSFKDTDKLNKKYSGDRGAYTPFGSGRPYNRPMKSILDLNQIFGGSAMAKLGILTGEGGDYPSGKPYFQSVNQVPKLLDLVNPRGPDKKRNRDMEAKLGGIMVKARLRTKSIYPMQDSEAREVGQSANLQKDLKETIGPEISNFGRRIQGKIWSGLRGSPPKIGEGAGWNHIAGQRDILGGLLEAGVKTAFGRSFDSGQDTQRPFDIDGRISPALKSFMGSNALRALELKVGEEAANTGGIPNKVFNKLYPEISNPSQKLAGLGWSKGQGSYFNKGRGAEANLRLGHVSGALKGVKPTGALGVIPNFANPLSDAIGRERAAGVPVSAIRVGSHPTLAAAGIPGGLGVTNTIDEPHGLKDVFGAGGIVPNFSLNSMIGGSRLGKAMGSVAGLEEASKEAEETAAALERFKGAVLKIEPQFSKLSEESAEQQKILDQLGSQEKQLAKQLQQQTDILNDSKKSNKQKKRATKKSYKIESELARTQAARKKEEQKAQSITRQKNSEERKLKDAIKRREVAEKTATKAARRSGGRGRMAAGRGMAGMMAMMGASMLAGQLEQSDDPTSKKAGGALQGASMGASMGMMLGPWGAAAGALIGGFMGLQGAAADARKELSGLATAAHREAENKRTGQTVASFKGLVEKHNVHNSLSNYKGGAAQWNKDLQAKDRKLGVDQGTGELWVAGVDEESKVGRNVMRSIGLAGSDFRSANQGVGDLMANWNDMDSGSEVKKALKHFGIDMEGDEVDFDLVRKKADGGTAVTGGSHEYSPLAFASALLDDETTRITKGGVWKHASRVKGSHQKHDAVANFIKQRQWLKNKQTGEWNTEDARGYINLNRNAAGTGGGGTVDLLGGVNTEYLSSTDADHQYKDVDKYFQSVLRNQLLDDLQGGGGGGFTAKALDILEDNHRRSVMGKSYDELFSEEIKDNSVNKLSDETTDGEIMSNIAYKIGALKTSAPKDRGDAWWDQMHAAEIIGEQQLDTMTEALGNSKIEVEYQGEKMKLDGKGLKALKERAKHDKRLSELILSTMNAGADKWKNSEAQLTLAKRTTTAMEISLAYDRKIIDAKQAMVLAMQKYSHAIDLAGAQNEGLIGKSAKDSGSYAKKAMKAGSDWGIKRMENSKKMRGEIVKLIMESEGDEKRAELQQALGLVSVDPKTNQPKQNYRQAGDAISFGGRTFQSKIRGQNVKTTIDDVINDLLSEKDEASLVGLAKNLSLSTDPDAYNAKMREQLKIRSNLDAKAYNTYMTVLDQADKELRINEIINGRVDLMTKLNRQNELAKLINQEQRMYEESGLRSQINNLKTGLARNMGGNREDRFTTANRTRDLEYATKIRDAKASHYEAMVDKMLGTKELKPMFTEGGPGGFSSSQFANNISEEDRYNYLRSITSSFEGLMRSQQGPRGIPIGTEIEKLSEMAQGYDQWFKDYGGEKGEYYKVKLDSTGAIANKFDATSFTGTAGHPWSAVAGREYDWSTVNAFEQAGPGTLSRDDFEVVPRGDRQMTHYMKTGQGVLSKDWSKFSREGGHPEIIRNVLKNATQDQSWDSADAAGQVALIQKHWDIKKKILEEEAKSLGNMDAMQTALYEVNSTLTKKDQIQQQTLEKMEAEYEVAKKLAEIEHKNQIGPGAFGRGMTKGLHAMKDQVDTFQFRLGQELPQQFSNSMSSALMKSIREGGKLKDVLLDAANSFLDAFNTKMMSHFMDQAVYNMFGAMGGTAGPAPSIGAKNKGGIIRRNKGGKIPTMLTNGEYVMNRGAVDRMGEGGMDALNSGNVTKRFGGGMMLAMGIGSALMQNKMSKKDEKPKWEERPDDRFQKNGAWKNYNMSTHYMQNNNRVKEHVGKLNEKKGEETQEFIQKWNRRQQLGRSLVTAVGSYGLGKLGQHIESKGGFAKADAWMGNKIAGDAPANINAAVEENVSRITGGMGGYSKPLQHKVTRMDRARMRLASPFIGKGSAAYNRFGGFSAGVQSVHPSTPASGKSGSWLSNLFDPYRKAWGLNKSKKLNSGGHISGPAGIDKVPAMLTEGEYVINANSARKIGVPTLNRINAGKFNSGGLVGENTGDLSGAGQNTNNINITVNVAKGGGKTDESSSPGGGNTDTSKMMDAFSQKIKQQVIMVVKQESRPGGLLGGK